MPAAKKLFFAGALSPADAQTLLNLVKLCSEERGSALTDIRTAASELHDGNEFPLLSLELGIAFHEAMVDVCALSQDTPRAFVD